MSALTLPDVTGMTLTQAALAYAGAGWYVLPVAPGSKNPGSVVGKDWHKKSSRDPDQIAAWWAQNLGYGIALHVGRSGAVAFDLDAMTLVVIVDAGRPDIAEALRSAGAINGTRAEGDRGHYLFACEPNEFGNSAGEFSRWGEVRGANGVIVVAPTVHPDADSKGGCYRQIKTGVLTPLPNVLRECLSDPGESVDPLNDAELDEFLDKHDNPFGCDYADCEHTPDGPVNKFNRRTGDEGASRHDTMVNDVLPWAFREAIAGCYPAREAFDALRTAWDDAMAATGERHRHGELYRLAKHAAARAIAEPQSEQVHDDADQAAADTDAPRLWRATDLRPSAPPSWLAKGRLPRGAISLLVGEEGIGKSLLWVWIAAAITTGKPRPEFGIPARDPAHVVVVVTEDNWSTAVRPRLEAAGADLSRVSVICTEADGSGAPVFPRDLHLIDNADPAPALVAVDAWLDTVPGKLNVRDPQDARKALHPWKETATKTGAAVLLITHTNRDKSADARDKYGITGELRKKARMTLYAMAGEQAGELIVGPEKSNGSATAPASKFYIESVQMFDPTDDNDGTVGLLCYLGGTSRTAREHVRDAAIGREHDDDDPRDLWLYGYLTLAGLAGQEVTPKDAVTAAKDEKDISRATVYRQLDMLTAARLAESVGGDTFPKAVRWQIISAPKPGETTGETTGGTSSDQHDQVGDQPENGPVPPVVSSTPAQEPRTSERETTGEATDSQQTSPGEDDQ